MGPGPPWARLGPAERPHAPDFRVRRARLSQNLRLAPSRGTSNEREPMPNTESAKKRVRQSEGRTLANKTKRSNMRTAIRKVREALDAGDKSQAQSLLPSAYQAIDKCAKANIIHDNNAAHQKAQLTKVVNA